MSVRRSPARHGGWLVKVEKGRHPVTGKRWTTVVSKDPETGRPIRTKTRAEQIERELLVKHHAGAREPSTLPLRDYLAQWMAETAGSREPSTQATYASIARAQINPRLGHVPLAKLDALALHGFYRGLGERYASTTVRATHAMLDAALRQAVHWRLLPHNPADAVKPPPGRPKPRTIWTAEQTAHFLAKTAEHPDHALWRFLIDSWCRIGEALALAWGDVDWGAGRVLVTKTVSRGEDGGKRITPRPKTEAGKRPIALAPATMAALRAHRRRQVARRLELGAHWQPGELVFDRGDGGLVEPGVASRALTRACREHGLPVVTFHCFRHGGATLAAEAGMPLKAISDRLGHASIAISADRYAHRSEAADRAIAEGMARLLDGGADTGS